jgi:hypothetical protein
MSKVVNSHNLEKELAEVKDTLQKESDEHDTLRITIGVSAMTLSWPWCRRQALSWFMPPKS